MKKLNRLTFRKAEEYIRENGRDLEEYRFEYRFKNAHEEKVANELETYQNDDGGFGHGLEPDFRLIDSSPMATSIALRYLKDIDNVVISQEIISSAITYLENSFDKERKGWYAVPEEVNNYPHAWWWHYNETKQMTIIDENWGNPSAEIIAYLYRYRNFTEKIDVDSLIDHAIKYIKNKESFESENELYCYVHLHEEIPKDKKTALERPLTKAIQQMVAYDREKWKEYVPTPLDFVKEPDDFKFGIDKENIEENLEFLIDELETNEVLEPNWDTSVYEGGLKPAYEEWKGILTLKGLIILDNYDMIER